MKRRKFNHYLLGSLTGLSLPSVAQIVNAGTIEADQTSNPLYASANVDDLGKYWLSVMDTAGTRTFSYPLPARAHQVLKHPTEPWLIVVARRPGHYIFVIDFQNGQLVKEVTPRMGFHFAGHIQVSQDGRFLYTTENLTQTSEGHIVVRDITKSFAIHNQFSSGGLGPHQLKLLNNSHQLVVANGGIHTQGREKLNLDSMSSNMSYIDLNNGEITQRLQLAPELAQLSIRHLDVNNMDDVIIAMQYQGEKTARVPLVAIHNSNNEFSFLKIPNSDYYSLEHYCGSACFDKSGHTIAVSAPRGDSILFWSTVSHQYLGKVKVRDGCGLAISNLDNQFIASSGQGKLYQINPVENHKKMLIKTPSLQWDNHLTDITL